MKKLSKVLVLVLSAIMVLAMSASVFAAGKGTITITLPTKEQAPTSPVTYEVYKVFDADGTADGVSYKVMNSKKNVALPTGFVLDKAGNVHHGTVDAEGNVTDVEATELTPAEIAAIKAYVGSDDPVATVTSKVGDETVTVEDLDNGYYYITTSTGSVVTIDTTRPNAEVFDKNTLSKVEKKAGTEFDSASQKAIAAVGTSQPFVARVTAGKGITKLSFTDTMTSMAFDDNVVVTLNDTAVAEGTDTFAVVGEEGDATFTVNFADKFVASLKEGDVIELKYSATVTDAGLVVNAAENKASITTDGNNTFESDVVKVYNANVSVNKVDGQNQPLAGAKFKLKNADGKYYAGATADGTANWTDAGIEVEAVEVTAADGTKTNTALFTGLGAGTYTLEESTVPAGYNKAADVTITISGNDYTTGNLEQTKTIQNQSGAELPSTGGIGTTIFYVLGSLLVVGCGIVLVSRKRMEKNN